MLLKNQFLNKNNRFSILTSFQLLIICSFSMKSCASSQLCGFYLCNRKATNEPKIESKGIEIPLKSSEYEVQIVNTIANITLIQTYINPTQKFLELQYSFPISPNACVYRFLAEFGNKKIEGLVRQKEEAKKQYKEAIKNGKQAALGQLDSERNDILKLEVGNVAPKQIIKIEITYLQELSLSYNMFYQFRMTATISPRYMNKISKEAMVMGFQNKAAKTKGDYYWNFKITLKTTKKVNFFDSKTHDIQLISQNDSQTQSIFAMTSQCVPNKDFVFTYTTEDYHLPCYVLGRTDFSSTALISFVPKFCDLNINDAYKASVAGTTNEIDIENAKGQYIFLLDRSGSMRGKRIDKAKQSLILFIKSLPQNIYFNIFSFGDGYRKLFQNSVKYNDHDINTAIKEVKKMDANLGGTQIYSPLHHILNEKPIDGYPKQIFLLTDGAVTNTQQVIDAVQAFGKYSRVHTIGIGNGASEALVKGCAEKGKGYHTFISDQENPSSKIIQLLTDSLSPVITKMKLSFDKNTIESIIPNPESLPYVLKNEIVNFYINFKGQLDQKTKITFCYQDSLNKIPYQSEIQIDPQSSNESFIDRMGQFKKIRTLQLSQKHYNELEDYMYYVKKVDKKAQIIDLSIKSQILSKHTAFLSIEKELIDGKYEEIKSIGQAKVHVENVMPIEYQKASKPISKCLSRPSSNLMKTLKSSTAIAGQRISTVISKREDEPNIIMKKKLKMVEKVQKYAQDAQECDEEEFISKQEALIVQKNIRQMQVKKMMALKNIKRDAKMQVKINQKAITVNSKQQSGIRMDIDEIISYQLSDGSWKDVRLIQKLLGADVIGKIGKQQLEPIMITFLVIRWIQQFFPQKEYSLVVKKGANFIKREKASMEELAELCSQLKI